MGPVTGYLFQATNALAAEEALRRKLEAIPGVTLLGDCLVTASREAEAEVQRVTKDFVNGHGI